jgi:iron complex transport system ATP-binding protein
MTALLKAEALHVEAGGARLLGPVDFLAGAGECVILVGPNGAGKSTLLRALAGAASPTRGAALLEGSPVLGMGALPRARALSYLPQSREAAWSVTAEALVALGRYAYGRPDRLGAEDRAAVDRALAAANIAHLRTRRVDSLSGGEMARVHVARALCAESPILIADEPTAALDPAHAHDIAALLRARADEGALVIAALHDVDLALRTATRVVLMDKGRIVEDRAAQDFPAPALERVFGLGAARDGLRFSR